MTAWLPSGTPSRSAPAMTGGLSDAWGIGVSCHLLGARLSTDRRRLHPCQRLRTERGAFVRPSLSSAVPRDEAPRRAPRRASAFASGVAPWPPVLTNPGADA